MRALFLSRFERFNAATQVLLGVLAFALALPIGLLISSPLLSVLVTFCVLAPLSILLVVAVASSVQRARNTLVAHRADTLLSLARRDPPIGQEDVAIPPDPAWKNALDLIAAKERVVLAIGARYSKVFLTPGGDDIGGVMHPLKDPDDLDAFNAWLGELDRLRAAHPTVKVVESMHRIEHQLHQLVGEARTGVNIAFMRATVELDREFTVYTDCQYGHWGVHNLLTVYTAPGGQRRVRRSCGCGSTWSEKI